MAGVTGKADSLEPELLRRLENLARASGKTINVNSGFRSDADQARVCSTGVKPCATPGQSSHRYGLAGDVSVGGTPIQGAFSSATLKRYGLWPLAGDSVHVELADARGGRLRSSLSKATLDQLYQRHLRGKSGGDLTGATASGTADTQTSGPDLSPAGIAKGIVDLAFSGVDWLKAGLTVAAVVLGAVLIYSSVKRATYPQPRAAT